MSKDLYEVLGVDQNATDADIKRAFRRKARELHPDVSKHENAEDLFKELNEAYDILSDPKKRSNYDRFGTVEGPGADPFGSSGFVDLGDLFSSFFGGSPRSTGTRYEGRDMGASLTITLEEAYLGCSKELAFDRMCTCDECQGSGVGNDGKLIDCPQCHGTGHVVTVQHTFLGDIQNMATCPGCNGTGQHIENPCSECDGEGRVIDRERITIEIPSGIRDGQKIRYAGMGEAGIRGAAAGDFIVTIRIEASEIFERDGNDLHAQLSVSVTQACLGARLSIDGVTKGSVIEVKIPEGCQHGQVLRIKHEGMPKAHGSGKGDMYIHVRLTVPTKLNKEQRALFESLADSFGEAPDATHTPLEKLRDVFRA